MCSSWAVVRVTSVFVRGNEKEVRVMVTVQGYRTVRGVSAATCVCVMVCV